MLRHFSDLVERAPAGSGLQQVLSQLATLYGLWSLQKHIGTLFQGFYVVLLEGMFKIDVCVCVCVCVFSGVYFSHPTDIQLLRDTILMLCSEVREATAVIILNISLISTARLQLKDQVVSLVDVIAPPDHILKSPIGVSNGKVR